MIDQEAELAQQNKVAEVLQSEERILLLLYKLLHDVHGVRMNGIEARILKLAPRKAN